MPTKPPLKFSDASGLADELQATDQVFGLRLGEADPTLRNKRWSLQTIANYVRGSFTPIETSAGIKDATDAGRKMLTAQDAAAQLTLVDKLTLAGDSSIGRPDFTRAYQSGGALLWLIEKVSLLLSQAAPAQPAAPTNGQVNDVAKEFTFEVVPAYPSYLQYYEAGRPGTTARALLSAATAYQVGTTVHVTGLSGAAKQSLAYYVAGSGTVPDGKPLTNGEAFSGAATPTPGATTPDAPFPSFDPATRTLTYAHALGTSELEINHLGGSYQPYAAVSVDDNSHSAGEWKARVKAYVAGNRNASGSADSPAIGAKAVTVNHIPVVSAGQDKTLDPGATSVALMGTATDQDAGDTLTYAWRQIIGPAGAGTATGMPATSLNVVVSNLAVGTYQFGFVATDDKGGKSNEAYVVVTVQAAAGSQDIHLAFAGNSEVVGIGAETADAFAAGVAAGLQNAVVALGSTQKVIYSLAAGDNTAQSGKTMHQLRVNKYGIDDRYKPGSINVLVLWEMFNQFRPSPDAGEGLDASVTDSAQIQQAIANGIAVLQGYCADRLAIHSDWVIVVGTPGPDNYNGSQAPYAPPRANFPTVIQQPVSSGLKALLANKTANYKALADVASDTVGDTSNLAYSKDGVHWTDYGYDKGNVIRRFVAAIMEGLFGIAQPAPVLKQTATSPAATRPQGAIALKFGQDNSRIVNNGQDGYYLPKGGVNGNGPGSYGNLTYTGYALTGAGCYGHVTVEDNALDVVLFFAEIANPGGFGDAVCGLWNSSQSDDGTDTVHRLAFYDSQGNPKGLRTGRPTTKGDTQAVFRVVNPDNTNTDLLQLRASTDGGNTWSDPIGTATYRPATGKALRLFADFAGNGACYLPFAFGAQPL